MGVRIEKPCSEDWSKMTPSDKGAMCQKCALEVYDFTGKTSEQIQSILTDQFAANKRTCGRIKQSQLYELSDYTFQWKNEQESFRAIWMVSLIAVFGMSLFSCQSTVSKEIVSQMEVSATEMIDEQSQRNPSDSSSNNTNEIAIPNSTLETELVEEISLPEISITTNNPDEIEVYHVLMESMILNGFIVMGDFSPGTEEPTMDFLERTASVASPHTTAPTNYNAPRSSTLTSLVALNDTGGNKITAYIKPNPIDESSHLFLTVNETCELQFELHNLKSRVTNYSKKLNFVEGSHKLDFNLHSLETGKYRMSIRSGTVTTLIDFVKND